MALLGQPNISTVSPLDQQEAFLRSLQPGGAAAPTGYGMAPSLSAPSLGAAQSAVAQTPLDRQGAFLQSLQPDSSGTGPTWTPYDVGLSALGANNKVRRVDPVASTNPKVIQPTASNPYPYGFDDASMYGWGNMTPGAQDTAGFYADLANYYQMQQAPQMARVGIDWSGMGGGAGPTPGASQQRPLPTFPNPPGYRAPTPQTWDNGPTVYPDASIVSTPPPVNVQNGTTPPPQQTTPTGGPPALEAQKYPSPPPIPGNEPGSIPSTSPTGGAGLASRQGSILTGGSPTGPTYSTQQTPMMGMAPSLNSRQGSLANAPIAGQPSTNSSPTGPSAPPAPPAYNPGLSLDTGPGNVSLGDSSGTVAPGRLLTTPPPVTSVGAGSVGTGQFSNPLFQQSQTSRNIEGSMLNGLSSPSMFANSQQGVEASGRAAEMGAMQRASSPQLFNTAQAGQADQSRNIQLNTMAQTTAPGLYNTQDYAQQQQSRAGQQGLVDRLNNDMAGNQPSLAELQLRRGAEANVANANALAASAGPGQSAMARRQAMQTASKQGQALAADTAALRAQEYAQARGELGQATTNLRGADITSQGQTFQNINATQDRAVQQATATRAADLQNAGMSYDNAIKQAQLEQTGAQSLRSGDIQRLGQEYQNTTNAAQIGSNVAIQSRAQDLTALGMSYDNAMKQAQFEEQQNAAQAQLEAGQRAQNAQMAGQLYGMSNATMSNDLASRMHYLDLMSSKYANDSGLAQQASQFQTQQNNLMTGTYLNAAGMAIGMFSDERLKENIEPANPDELSDLFGQLTPSMFGYAKPEYGDDENIGIMAQDLEKSRLGKLLVKDTPIGKMVDIRKTVGALLATGANTEQRLRKLEGR